MPPAVVGAHRARVCMLGLVRRVRRAVVAVVGMRSMFCGDIVGCVGTGTTVEIGEVCPATVRSQWLSSEIRWWDEDHHGGICRVHLG